MGNSKSTKIPQEVKVCIIGPRGSGNSKKRIINLYNSSISKERQGW